MENGNQQPRKTPATNQPTAGRSLIDLVIPANALLDMVKSTIPTIENALQFPGDNLGQTGALFILFGSIEAVRKFISKNN